MVKAEWSSKGIWYTVSHKGERVYHLLRIGSTSKDRLTIYEFIIWKLRIVFG
jgi:hypothetical protein